VKGAGGGVVVVLLIWLVLHVQTKSVAHAKNIIKILLNFKYAYYKH